jgi:predicted permease
MYLIGFIFILILVLVFFYLNQNTIVEMFTNAYQTYQSFVPINSFKYPMYPMTYYPFNWFNRFFPISNAYTNLPWWNTPLGNTTNMSYDLRGDPLIIPRTNFVWNNSSILPIYNQGV